MTQPTPTTSKPISIPALVLFGVAVLAVTLLGVIIAAQAAFPVRVYEGATALLASLTALGGTGVIICVVADRVMCRLDQLEAKLDEQREQDYAERFVADAARGRHLTAVRN